MYRDSLKGWVLLNKTYKPFSSPLYKHFGKAKARLREFNPAAIGSQGWDSRDLFLVHLHSLFSVIGCVKLPPVASRNQEYRYTQPHVDEFVMLSVHLNLHPLLGTKKVSPGSRVGRVLFISPPFNHAASSGDQFS